jgi:hypothetical protein
MQSLYMPHLLIRYCHVFLICILFLVQRSVILAQFQSPTTEKASSGNTRSITLPLTPEILSSHQVIVRIAPDLPLAHSPFSLVFMRVNNSTLQPVTQGANKGRLRFSEQSKSVSLPEVSDSVKVLQEVGEWEIGYRARKTSSLGSASDTAIVGGVDRASSQTNSGGTFDLKIKYRQEIKLANRTTTVDLEWLLNVTELGTASGRMTGYIESKYDDTSGSDTVSSIENIRIDSDGNMVTKFVTINKQSGYGSESTITFDREGGLTTVTKDSFNAEETTKEKSKQKPVEFNRHWFDIRIGNAIDRQLSGKNKFPHDNPCLDPVFRRLANEQYSEEVIKRLEELKPKYLLQPLGSRDSNLLFESSTYANYDRYSITIPKKNFPASFSPSEELIKWPSNFGAVPLQNTKASEVFNSINTFSSSEYPAKLGGVIGIKVYPAIPGFPGIVNVMITQMEPTYFRVSTLETEVTPGRRLRHPVSGSREFGFVNNVDGSITFYTQGLDSPASNLANTIGGFRQKEGWTNFMIGLGQRFGMTQDEAAEIVARDSFSNRSIDDKPDCN